MSATTGYRPIRGNVALSNHEPARYFTIDWPKGKPVSPADLDKIERDTEQAVLSGQIVVVDPRNPRDVWERMGVVPLRWGAPRIVLKVSGYTGKKVAAFIEAGEEPVRTWRLWRYKWDDFTDLLALPPLKRGSKALG